MNVEPRLTVKPAGDAAVMVELGDRIDPELNRLVHRLADTVAERLERLGRVEVVPAYASFLVSFNPRQITHDDVERAVHGLDLDQGQPSVGSTSRFILPVSYGGQFGPDLDEVARRTGLTADEVIERHAGRDYPIFCIGFAPGFPFLGGLDPALHTPRLENPRPLVPRGSVAIGGAQTGVYPTSTPGGWRIIGRTPLTLFDVERDPPIPYRPGDVIRFEPIDEAEFLRIEPLRRMPIPETLLRPPKHRSPKRR
ncbi:MAG TPA: 5-oxoprolinase subunit PxpB [Chloroflexota bacterium]|nr:5-oxoprolinase subunit PxpB [Chloroflexota bacterium]